MDLSSIEQIIRTRVPNAPDSEVELYLDSVKRDMGFGGDYSDMSEDDIVEDFDETIRLGENMVYEELCPKGKAYIKKRMAALAGGGGGGSKQASVSGGSFTPNNSYMQERAVTVQVEGRIKGNDIYISNSKESNRRNNGF